MSSGNVEDLWDVKLADELPAAFGASAGDVFDTYYAPVWLPDGVALATSALGAGIEFGAVPALTDDPVADYLTATTHRIKNINGTVTNSPLSGATNPTGGQAFWLYVHDTSAFSAGSRRARRLSAREALLGSAGVAPVVAPAATPGAPVVRAFPFAFDSPNILTGHAVYTPTVGDILLDAWIEIDTAWNGTTPLGDFGEFVGTAQGLFAGGNGPTGLTTMSGPDTNLVGVGYLAGNNGESLAALSAAGSAGFRVAPGKFTTVDPIKVVVSQDGTNTGADPGSTQGAAVLYLVTATPVGA
jgi:hypothetical protein